MSLRHLCGAIAFLAAAAASAQEVLPDRQASFGAGLAPAAMPSGASAAYGFVGAPEVGAGYRQGIGGIELEGRASFDYLMVAFAAEGLVKYSVYQEGRAEIAPVLGVGVVSNTGAVYADPDNFGYFAIRPRAGLVSSIWVAETVRAIVQLDVPWDITLHPQYGSRVRPLLGGGAEVYLGSDLSLFGLGQVGLDAIKQPFGLTQYRLGYQVKLGLGWRLF